MALQPVQYVYTDVSESEAPDYTVTYAASFAAEMSTNKNSSARMTN